MAERPAAENGSESRWRLMHQGAAVRDGAADAARLSAARSDDDAAHRSLTAALDHAARLDPAAGALSEDLTAHATMLDAADDVATTAAGLHGEINSHGAVADAEAEAIHAALVGGRDHLLRAGAAVDAVNSSIDAMRARLRSARARL